MDEPIYSYVIHIGNVTGKTELDQILELIGLDEEKDFIWWNSSTKLEVNISDELQNDQTVRARSNSNSFVEKNMRKRASSASSNFYSALDSVLAFSNKT